MSYVSEPVLRGAVMSAIDDFEQRAAPILAGLDKRVIHGDLNPDNVVCNDLEQVHGRY